MLPFPSCPSPSTGVRNCQAKVMELAYGPDAPPQGSAPPQPCSKNLHRRRWLLQGSHPDEGRERGRKGLLAARGAVVTWAWRLPGQLGCHVGWVGGAVSPREQAGFGGSRLCLHLPRTPSPRSPLIPGASPTPGLCAICTFAASAAGSCLSQPRAPHRGSWDLGAPSSAHWLPSQGLV